MTKTLYDTHTGPYLDLLTSFHSLSIIIRNIIFVLLKTSQVKVAIVESAPPALQMVKVYLSYANYYFLLLTLSSSYELFVMWTKLKTV